MQETCDLLAQLPRSHSHIRYSRPASQDHIGSDFDMIDHLDIPLLQALGVPQADFYLCGPAAFLDTLTNKLKVWGVTPACIYEELFGPGLSVTPGIVSTTRKPPHVPVHPSEPEW